MKYMVWSLVVIGALIALNWPKSAEDQASANLHQREAEAQAQAEIAVGETARDPDSLKFENESIAIHEHGVMVCGLVNGKNAFGAMAGFRAFGWMKSDDGKSRLIMQNEEPMAYAAICGKG